MLNVAAGIDGNVGFALARPVAKTAAIRATRFRRAPSAREEWIACMGFYSGFGKSSAATRKDYPSKSGAGVGVEPAATSSASRARQCRRGVLANASPFLLSTP